MAKFYNGNMLRKIMFQRKCKGIDIGIAKREGLTLEEYQEKTKKEILGDGREDDEETDDDD